MQVSLWRSCNAYTCWNALTVDSSQIQARATAHTAAHQYALPVGSARKPVLVCALLLKCSLLVACASAKSHCSCCGHAAIDFLTDLTIEQWQHHLHLFEDGSDHKSICLFHFHLPPANSIDLGATSNESYTDQSQSSGMLISSCATAGLFIPSLALGASWGRMIGMIVRHAAGPGGPSISLASYAVSTFSLAS